MEQTFTNVYESKLWGNNNIVNIMVAVVKEVI